MTVSRDEDISRFATMARAYCAFVREASAYDDVARLRTTARLLASLYGLGLRLPACSGTSMESEDDEVSVERPEFGFSDHEYYFVVGRPFDLGAPEITCGALSDDALDVFADVAAGLAWYDRGRPDRAARYWTAMFYHWGKHVVDALTALHDALEALPCGRRRMTELVREVEDFFVAAEDFCAFMWNAAAWPRDERLREAATLLAALYAASLALPEGEDLGEDAPPLEDDARPDIAPFEAIPPYQRVSAPLDLETSPIRTFYSSLSADLELVCTDVDTALMHFENGHAGYAVHRARRGQESHWGTLAVHALRALHILLHPGELGPSSQT